MEPQPYARYLGYWDEYVTSFIDFALTGFAVLVVVRSMVHFYTGELPGFILFLPIILAILVPFSLHQLLPKKISIPKKRQLISVKEGTLLSWLFSYPYKFFWISFALSVYLESFLFSEYRSELTALLFIAPEYYRLVSEFFLIPLLLFLLTMGMSGISFVGNKLHLPIGVILILMLVPLFAGVGLLGYIDANPELRESYISLITNMIGVVSIGWLFQLITVIKKPFN